jgi:AcrR family transcriptional regulator
MSKTNLNTILEKSAKLYAGNGFENFTIRKLAKQIPISPSVIYHYFKDEEQLLISMFDYLNKDLGRKRAMLEQPKSAKQMLKQRIEFQLDNQEEIVAVLKYYLANRNKFPKFKNGFVPDKSALHIEEVLRFGSKTKEFYVRNLEDDAKVITHAINGFLLEYYPYFPQGNEKKQLVNRIYNFLIRALKGGEKK